MEKRKHTLSLSFVLLRFVAGMFVTMLLCFMIWSLVMSLLEQKGIICSGSEINHQVEEILGTQVVGNSQNRMSAFRANMRCMMPKELY